MHANPLVYDIDKDGVREIALTTYNGEVLFFRCLSLHDYDYGDYVDESMWGDEEWTEVEHEKVEKYVDIDAHLVCTPVSELLYLK